MQTPQTMTEIPLAKQIIKRQLNRSGNILMSSVEPMTDLEFFERQINNISIAWTVGHLACVMDLFGGWLCAEGRQFSPDIHQVFNPLELGHKTLEKWEMVNPNKLGKADILLLLRQAQVRLLAILEDFNLDLWNTMPPPHVPDTLPTYGAIWESLGVHTYWHLGELCGCTQRFYGTYTLNSVLHYYYIPRPTPPVKQHTAIEPARQQPAIEPVKPPKAIESAKEPVFSIVGHAEENKFGNKEITVFLSL